MAWQFDFFETDVGQWLADSYESGDPEASLREFEQCFAELQDVLTGATEELSPECQERLNRNPDGSEPVADTSVGTFLSEWWWALGLVAAWLWLRTDEAGG